MENYEKRLKDIVSSRNTPFADIGVILRYFPELRESEDEKWRKWLIGHLSGYINQTDAKYAEACKNAIAWLEKQGEEKPLFKKGDTVIWQDEEFNVLDVTKDNYNVGGYLIPIYRQNELSLKQNSSCTEENEAILDDIITAFKRIGENHEHYFSPDTAKVFEKTLKSLKDRVQPQPKQEWGEEDEENRKIINKAIWKYIGENGITQGEAGKLIQWLKSLKDRVHPKR